MVKLVADTIWAMGCVVWVWLWVVVDAWAHLPPRSPKSLYPDKIHEMICGDFWRESPLAPLPEGGFEPCVDVGFKDSFFKGCRARCVACRVCNRDGSAPCHANLAPFS